MHKKGEKAVINHHTSGNNVVEFRRIVEEYRPRVYHTAYGVVQDTEDAKDITQEVFIKIYERMDSFKGEAKLSTWIYRITVNTCIDMLRKRKSGTQVTLQEGLDYDSPPAGDTPVFHHSVSPFEATYNAELQVRIKGAFLKLSPEHRSVLVLREIEGLSYQEIADSLACSVGTVMSRLHYARKKMQKLLAPVLGGKN